MSNTDLDRTNKVSEATMGILTWVASISLAWVHNWKFGVMGGVSFLVMSFCIGFISEDIGKKTAEGVNKLKRLRTLSGIAGISLVIFVLTISDKELQTMVPSHMFFICFTSSVCMTVLYRVTSKKRDKDILLNTFGIIRAGVIVSACMAVACIWSFGV